MGTGAVLQSGGEVEREMLCCIVLEAAGRPLEALKPKGCLLGA